MLNADKVSDCITRIKSMIVLVHIRTYLYPE